MAVVYEETVSREKVFQCDRCKKTKPVSLGDFLKNVFQGSDFWYLSEKDNCLCPDCVKIILANWYNQEEVGNFKLHGSGESKRKKARHLV